MENSSMQQHIDALSSLSRRELQARAKALGLRANGKNVEMIESIARVLSASTDTGGLGEADRTSNDGTMKTSSVETKGTPATGADADPCDDCAPESDSGARHIKATLADLQAGFPAASMSVSAHNPSHDSSPVRDATSGASMESAPVAPSPAAITASTPTFQLPNPTVTGSTTPSLLADLAARASAAALAASLNNLRFESALKPGAVRMTTPTAGALNARSSETTQAQPTAAAPDASGSELDDNLAAEGPLTSSRSDNSDLTLPSLEDLDAAGADAFRHLTFEQQGAAAGSPAAVGEDADMADDGGHGCTNCSAAALATAGSDCPQTPANASKSHAAATASDGISSPMATEASASATENGNCQAATSPPKLVVAATPQRSVAAETEMKLDAAAVPLALAPPPAALTKPTAVLVTDRTPLRQQRMMGLVGAPAPGVAAGATPIGRSLFGAGGGLLLHRTPGTGLRTPARRVPVCSDEAQARAVDEWVTEKLTSQAGQQQPKVLWRDMAGLEHAKQRLQAICTAHAAPLGPHAATCEPAASSQQQSNAAVLLYGPAGMGKACLARALAWELGAAYIHVPPDLPSTCNASRPADALLRSVFRVAIQLPGLAVVHVEDLELWAGTEAGRQSSDCRRLRTELLVGVEELLLSTPGKASAAAAGEGSSAPAGCAAAASAASGCGGKDCTSSSDAAAAGRAATGPRVKVLVLATSSWPMALDASLAGCLGRTERLMAALPGADERECYLVGRLAAEGAALGVEQVEGVVRQTEGYAFAELSATCDQAVALAAQKASSRAAGGACVGEAELAAALQRVRARTTPEAAGELVQWHTRTSGVPAR